MLTFETAFYPLPAVTPGLGGLCRNWSARVWSGHIVPAVKAVCVIPASTILSLPEYNIVRAWPGI